MSPNDENEQPPVPDQHYSEYVSEMNTSPHVELPSNEAGTAVNSSAAEFIPTENPDAAASLSDETAVWTAPEQEEGATVNSDVPTALSEVTQPMPPNLMGVAQPVYPDLMGMAQPMPPYLMGVAQPVPPDYPGMVQPAPRQRRAILPDWLARPFPLWLFVAGIVLIMALLFVMFVTGSDWANGAVRAGWVALTIDVLCLIGWYVRARQAKIPVGMLRRVVSIVCLVLLFVSFIVAQVSQTTLHLDQARSLENQQQWAQALQEYELAGENAPDGVDLARIYTSWGLALNKTQQYALARSKFALVMDQFGMERDQVQRAQAGDLVAGIALAKQSLQAGNYTQATGDFDAILKLDYCGTACDAQVQPLDATAYYDLGLSDLQAKDYNDAVSAFHTVLSNFPNTPVAKTSSFHSNIAQALFGLAEATRSSSCSNSITLYQELAQHYGDTPQGQEASSDLSKPESVSGTFHNSSSVTYTQIGLTHGLVGNMSEDAVFNAWFAASYTTTIQKNGSFTFNNVRQGSYDLIWYNNNGTTEYAGFEYDKTNLAPVYTADVGPICPVDLGSVDAI